MRGSFAADLIGYLQGEMRVQDWSAGAAQHFNLSEQDMNNVLFVRYSFFFFSSLLSSLELNDTKVCEP
jgi:hypothetical protein